MNPTKQEAFIMNLYPQLSMCSRAILKDIRHNSASKQMRMLAHKMLISGYIRTKRNN